MQLPIVGERNLHFATIMGCDRHVVALSAAPAQGSLGPRISVAVYPDSGADGPAGCCQMPQMGLALFVGPIVEVHVLCLPSV